MMIEHGAEHKFIKQEDTVLNNFNQIKTKVNVKFDSAREVSSQNLQKVNQLQKERLKRDQEDYIKERLSKLTLFLREKF